MAELEAVVGGVGARGQEKVTNPPPIRGGGFAHGLGLSEAGG